MFIHDIYEDVLVLGEQEFYIFDKLELFHELRVLTSPKVESVH